MSDEAKTSRTPDAGRADAARRRARGTTRIVTGALIVALVIAAGVFLPVGDWLRAFLEWTQSLGAWGFVVFAVVYVVATVLFLPGLILTMGAGAIFGLLGGTIAVSLGSTVGVAAAFLVGRYVARGRIEAALASRPRFRAIDAAVGREGFKIVLLTRLSPVFPFNLLNYAYGVTGVSFRDYLLASWIGMIPGTVMYVYFGAVAGGLARVLTGEAGPDSATRNVVALIGGALAVVVTLIVTRLARRALRDAIRSDETD